MNGTEDADVPASCVVYRIVNIAEHIKESGEVKSGAFSNSSPREGEAHEDCYMSVFFEDEMSQAGKTTRSLLDWWRKPAKLVSFTADDLRKLGEEFFRHPISEFSGHGGVWRADRKRRTGAQKTALKLIGTLLD